MSGLNVLSKKTILWFLMLVIAFWIVILPALCRAEPRPWIGEEKTLFIWSCGATLADIGTTIGFLGNSDNWAGDPILWP